jgi:hypothetical protein
MPPGTGWSLFWADFTLPAAGDYRLGIRNTIVMPYFINYDAVAIQAIPEPAAAGLVLAALVAWQTGRVYTRRRLARVV